MKLGIIGARHGLRVLLPAFRADPRCEVIAMAGLDGPRMIATAQQVNVPQARGGWQELLRVRGLNAVAIAVPPMLQPEIIRAAFERGLAVFAEKPLAGDVVTAIKLLRAASGHVAAVDFAFPELVTWKYVKRLLDNNAIGKLRHVNVNWYVENAATRNRVHNWKTATDQGGGALGNFVSHSLHYLEWFCGSIFGLSAQLSGLPDDPNIETNVGLHLHFLSGASGHYAMSCGAYLGSGHHLEFYGDEGTITLTNPTAQYTRGFVVRQAMRSGALLPVVVEESLLDRLFPKADFLAPTAQLAQRFIDSMESGQHMSPGFVEGVRVQELIDAVRRSHTAGSWVSIPRNTLWSNNAVNVKA